MSLIQNPVKVCNQVFSLIENLTHQIQERMQDPSSVGGCDYYSLPSKVSGMDAFLRNSRSLWFYAGSQVWPFLTVCLRLRPAALPQ